MNIGMHFRLMFQSLNSLLEERDYLTSTRRKDTLVVASGELVPRLKSFGQKEILQIFLISSDVLSVTFLRGLDPSPINKG